MPYPLTLILTLQVEHKLLCSPFNIISIIFFWLPAGQRRKAHPFFFYRASLCFLDGRSCFQYPRHIAATVLRAISCEYISSIFYSLLQ